MNPPEPEPGDDPAQRGQAARAPRGGTAAPAAGRPTVEITGQASAEVAVELARLLAAALGHLRRPLGRVTLRVVDEAEMIALHERFLGIPEPTDVLTFPAGDGAPLEIDIAVCADVARAEAARRGHAPVHELLLYAVHGLLHESGHDDRDEAAAAAMHAEEDRILRAIGVGPVFGREESAA